MAEEEETTYERKSKCHWTRWTAILSLAVAFSFLVATAVLQANSTAAPAYIFCDPEPQYYANGSTVTVADMTVLHVCWFPVSPRWAFFGFLCFQLVGVMTMWMQTSYGGIYSTQLVMEKRKSAVVQDQAMTDSVTSNKKRKRAALNAIKQQGGKCCGFIDGFYFVHLLAVPFMWLLYIFMNTTGRESELIEAGLFLIVLNFAKVFPLLDEHARYAAVGLSVFIFFSVFELLSLFWRGVSVFRTYASNTAWTSGWMVAWWCLILSYIVIFDVYVFSVLNSKDVKIDKLAAALLQKTRVKVVILDSLYVWLTGCILFAFIH